MSNTLGIKDLCRIRDALKDLIEYQEFIGVEINLMKELEKIENKIKEI